ncbi:MAG: hypothetical protein ABIA97_01305 [Candidatus Omnitrophota bacterium]
MERVDVIFRNLFRNLKQSKGSILIEAVIAMSVFLLLLGLVFAVLATGKNAWHIEDVSIELQQELRKGTGVIMEDLRQTASSQIVGVTPNGTWYDTITFRKPVNISGGFIVWSPQIQFLLGGLNNRQLLKRTGVNDEVIANNINSLQIRRQWLSRNIIEISLSSDKATVKGTQIDNNINFQVKIRN